MLKRIKKNVEFFEAEEKIIMYADSIKDEVHTICGKVYINHDQREIRIYDFPLRRQLKECEKVEIIYSILESLWLFPFSERSNAAYIGDITQYTLLINGYLTDGTFKEPRVRYKSIIEEFIDTAKTDEENTEILNLRLKIKHFYNKYEEVLGKESVVIYLLNNKIVSGIVEYINFTRLFSSYLKSKGKRFRMITNNKFWDKEKKLEILPY